MTDIEKLCRDVELRVFGDDLTANTDERLGRMSDCLLEWWDIRSDHKFNQSKYTLRFILDEDGSRGFIADGLHHGYAWDHRHGKPWQSDLEAFVAAWRDEPRSPAELCEAVKAKVYVWESGKSRDGVYYAAVMVDRDSQAMYTTGKTENEAFLRAALESVGAEVGSTT